MTTTRTDHLVWRVEGADPLGLLEATTTQHVADLALGERRAACLLTEHGRVQALLRIARTADGSVLLDGPAIGAEGVAWVARLAPLSSCTITLAEDLAVLRTGDDHVSDAIVVDRRFDGLPGVDAIVPTDAPACASAAAAADADEHARIALGWPRFGLDVTTDSILNDTPYLFLATSFTKGCYRGQETVAKIRNLGHARRRMVRAATTEDADWRAGAAVTQDGVVIGSVSSAASMGTRSSAIATIKAGAHDGEAEIDGVPCTLEAIVLADEPAAPPPPSRTLRLGMR